MKCPEEVKAEFTREWISKAESDLAVAQHLYEGGELYGVEYRYPGDYPDVTIAEAANALSTIRRVRDVIRSPDCTGPEIRKGVGIFPFR